MAFESFWTWQNFVRFCKGQEPLTPTAAAAASAAAAAAAAAKAARGGKRGRPPMGGGGRGLPPLAPGTVAAAGSGMRRRTLDGAFGITGRAGGSPGGVVGGAGGVKAAAGDSQARIAGRREGAEPRAGSDGRIKDCRYKAWEEELRPDPGSASDSSDDCSVVEVRGGKAANLTAGGGGGGTVPSVAQAVRDRSPQRAAEAVGPASSIGVDSDRVPKRPRRAGARCGREEDDRGDNCSRGYSGCPVGGGARWGGPRASTAVTTTARKARSLSFADDKDDGNGHDSGGGVGGSGGDGGGGGGGGSSGGGGGGGGLEVLQCDLSDSSPSPPLPSSSVSTGVGGVATSADRPAPLNGDATKAIPRAGGFAAPVANPYRRPDRANSARGDGGGRSVDAPHGSRTAAAGVNSVHSISGDSLHSSDSSGDIHGSSSVPANSGGVVVDLSLDSPSPPPPPRSRTYAAAQLLRQAGKSGGGNGGGNSGAVEACSSDDEFAM